MRDEDVCGRNATGSDANDQRFTFRSEKLNSAMLCTGFPYTFATARLRARLRAVHDGAQAVRRDGSAALDLAYVACGRFDGFWEDGLSPWDIAAGALLISEARGTITNFKLEQVDIYNEQVLASNGLIHDAMLQVLTS